MSEAEKDAADCPRKPGGCPCVQPGGSPGLPTGFRVRKVIRIEDSAMWDRYAAKRKKIQDNRGDCTSGGFDVWKGQACKSDDACDNHPDLFDPLDKSLNEVYLLHGTNIRAALSIAQNDFRIDLAGSNAGTMYGRGCYLAESCTKGDEYASDDPGTHYDKVFGMLVCRTCLGLPYYTMTRDEGAGAKVVAGEYDSTLGDRERKVNTFREFVVYDPDQVYPEYIILFHRIFAGDPPIDWSKKKADIQMEVPPYWENMHKNPRTEPFNTSRQVTQHDFEKLQALVDASKQSAGLDKAESHLKRVTRVENSDMWNRYIDKKKALSEKHPNGCTRARDLDGNPHTGMVITKQIMRAAGDADALSDDVLKEKINEYLLFHGTSKSAADAIVHSGFKIGHSGADRFGSGAYLAEDISKALNYAQAFGSTRYVLVCRVACGDFLYTEEANKGDATKVGQAQGKDATLANPKEDWGGWKAGCREFIVYEPDQVYAEYILEIDS